MCRGGCGRCDVDNDYFGYVSDDFSVEIVMVCGFFFLMVFGFIEGVYFIVVCVKVLYGGWVFFVIVLMFFVIFFCWNYGRWIKYLYEVSYKISFDNLGVLIFSMGI